MSAWGHSLPSHLACGPTNVGCCSNSVLDFAARRMQQSANKRHCSLSRGFDSTLHIHGTHVPVEEPFTASEADITPVIGFPLPNDRSVDAPSSHTQLSPYRSTFFIAC